MLTPFFMVALFNLFTAPELKYSAGHTQKVSVLIPARNEEKHITETLLHLLSLKDQIHEIIVLDDNSTDKTKALADDFSAKNERVKILYGQTLPEGWLGKNNACMQLAESATGDYFIFLDCDVRIKNGAISFIIGQMIDKKLTMASVFPTQIMTGFGERLVVPLMNWLLLNFLPLRLVYSSKNPSFVAANGQILCFRAVDYFELGGHASVKSSAVEDMELARLVKKSARRMAVFTGGSMASCTMYNSFTEAVNGFSKNFFAGFNLPAPVFVIFLLFTTICFLLPVAGVFFSPWFFIPLLMIFIQRTCVSYISKQPVVYNILLHPLQMFVFLYTGLYSLRVTLSRKIEWKGRTI